MHGFLHSAWFSQHPHLYVACVLVAYYFVSAATEKLPVPTAQSGLLYKTLYASLTAFTAKLKASVGTFKTSVLPQVPPEKK